VAAKTLLIVVPDLDLRRSLEFALEAEGYFVTSAPDIESARSLPAKAFDCTVLDHAATVGSPAEVIRFCAASEPVVVLSDKPIPWLSEWVSGVVEKPMLGQALLVAIRKALGKPELVETT
jgi:DNA-binding response OmpR family regulator